MRRSIEVIGPIRGLGPATLGDPYRIPCANGWLTVVPGITFTSILSGLVGLRTAFELPCLNPVPRVGVGAACDSVRVGDCLGMIIQLQMTVL